MTPSAERLELRERVGHDDAGEARATGDRGEPHVVVRPVIDDGAEQPNSTRDPDVTCATAAARPAKPALLATPRVVVWLEIDDGAARARIGLARTCPYVAP
jgi:hypothetical protein